MRIKTLVVLFALICAILISSCGSSRSGAHSNNAYNAPKTSIKSINEYDLNVSSEGVTYTIDISTPEGRAKLNGLSIKEAEDLALTEAVIKYGCAMLVNPQYTNLTKGKKVLRITVYGFPARYKNTK